MSPVAVPVNVIVLYESRESERARERESERARDLAKVAIGEVARYRAGGKISK